MHRSLPLFKRIKLNFNKKRLYSTRPNKNNEQKDQHKSIMDSITNNIHATNYIGNVEEISKEIFERIKQIDEFSKIRGYSTLKIFLWTCFSLIVIIIIFRKDIKHFLQDHGYEVFNNTLSNDEVVKKAAELSTYIVSEILVDAEILAVALIFLNSLTADKDFQVSFLSLLDNITLDQQTSETLRIFFIDLSRALINDPQFYAETINFLYSIAVDPRMQQSFKNFGYEVVTEKEMMIALSNFAYEVAITKEFKKAFGTLAKDSFLESLEDEEMKVELYKFANSIFSDKDVQIGANDAMWEALKNSFFGYWYR